MDWTPAQLKVLAFETNLSVLAGAGSGKTKTLVDLIIRLLTTTLASSSPPLDLTQILAMTFTDKAAGEMKDRLRQAIIDQYRNAPIQDRLFWLRQRRLLDRAQLVTIHGFCRQVLHEFAMEAGLDADFRVLDNNRDFLTDLRKQTLLTWVENQDQAMAPLLDYFAWISRGHRMGLDQVLAKLIDYRRTLGRQIVVPLSPAFEVRTYREQLLAAARLIDQLVAAGQLSKSKSYFRTATAWAAAVHGNLRPEMTEEELLDLVDELQSLSGGNWQKANEARRMAKQALDDLAAEKAQRLVRPVMAILLTLADKMTAVEDEAKTRAAVVDFHDLLLMTRKLLAENVVVRKELKNRYQVILVDEFQDTNRLQADIIALLTEPSGHERSKQQYEEFSRGLSLAPRRLVVLGDPKQSIYRFRGAEVEVFTELQSKLTAAAPDLGGQVISLDRNFRSQKRLVEFFNNFFSKYMSGGPPWAAAYTAEDQQQPHRPDTYTGPAAIILVTKRCPSTAESRAMEARYLADYLSKLIQGRTLVRVGPEGRPPLPKDVAILLRRFTYLKVYEQALRQAGLPFYTVRGQGFYNCPEIWDLINLVCVLADPGHGPGWLGLLRSPLVGLDNEVLTRLAWPANGTFRSLPSYFGLIPVPWPAELTDADKGLLEKTRSWLPGLIDQAGRCFPAELLESAVEQSDYLAVLMAQDQGEQKVANVQRLIEITRHLPLEVLASPRFLARYLKARRDDSGDDAEAQAGVEASDVIQIMTIHQAKGLEFPIVLVPDAAQRYRSFSSQVVFGPEDQMALRVRDPQTHNSLQSSDFVRYWHENQQKEKAEHQRLLYVAATRARDHLVFSGESIQNDDSWMAHLREFAAEQPALLKELPFNTGIEERRMWAAQENTWNSEQLKTKTIVGPKLEDSPTPQSAHLPGPDVHYLLSRALERGPALPKSITLNVTSLAVFQTCPRHYFLEHVLGLPARSPSAITQIASPTMSPREKGLLFHHLLETLAPGCLPPLSDLLERARNWVIRSGWEVPWETLAEIVDKVTLFFQHPWGQDLARSTDGLIRREAPIWLLIKPETPDQPSLTLTGEIDLFYITPEGLARLIDYKFSRVKDLTRYETQVKVYALALSKSGLAGRLEAGLYFAEEPGGLGVGIDLPSGWAEEFEADLCRSAWELSRILAPGQPWPPAPRVCPDPACGFDYGCGTEDGSETSGGKDIGG